MPFLLALLNINLPRSSARQSSIPTRASCPLCLSFSHELPATNPAVIKDTSLAATVTIQLQVNLDIVERFLPLLNQQIASMNPSDNLQKLTIRPHGEYDSKNDAKNFYGLFQIFRKVHKISWPA